MPDYRRYKLRGGTYFFTLVTEGRKRFLTLPSILPLLKESLDKVQARHPFELKAYVLLPDHLHCMATLPDGDADYSMRIMKFKRYFTLRAASLLQDCLSNRTESKISRREGGVWQRRFCEHCIRDDMDLQRHANYIAYNPVKHGYVTRAEDWPHLSIPSAMKTVLIPQKGEIEPNSDWRDLPAGE
jgi:putative transposase